MDIRKHFNKENLHHAYLIEGTRAEVLPEILRFMEEIGVITSGNPDFLDIILDSFKIDDAKNLKSLSMVKSVGNEKKIFVISANNFLLEAQNSLLKIFEEPTVDTHFFLILPDSNILLPTLASRFYHIASEKKTDDRSNEVKKFLAMSLQERIDFLKKLLVEEEEDKEGTISLESSRFRALSFLNALESILHERLMLKMSPDTRFFHQIFTTRELLRQPGSSLKIMMESLALNIPSL